MIENKKLDEDLQGKQVDATLYRGMIGSLMYLTARGANGYVIGRNVQNQRDLPRDIPLDNVVLLRYEKGSKSENKRKVPTEMELTLEQTQQGVSYEVWVSIEGVEE
ncbi:hypothetical protein Tco_0065390 [Tanacetum coccineum]